MGSGVHVGFGRLGAGGSHPACAIRLAVDSVGVFVDFHLDEV